MNHRPFEDWLINDQHLTPSERHELDVHLRTCKICSALMETGVELRSARMLAPKAGFSQRFQNRLVAYKAIERHRRIWGMMVMVMGGGALFVWLTAPYLISFVISPAQWITYVIGYFLFIASSVQAVTQALRVLFNVAPGILPTYMWMTVLSILAGLGLLWSVSIWRFTRSAQGA